MNDSLFLRSSFRSSRRAITQAALALRTAKDTARRDFGHHLRVVRRERRMSVRELARRGSVSPSFISDIEHGRRMPSTDVAHEIIEALCGDDE